MNTVSIAEAAQVGPHRLRLTFSDGKVQLVDFGPFLAEHGHPAIRAWLEPEQFSRFRIEYGDLVWGDYELCFPIADLYENRIDRDRVDVSA